MYNNFRPNRSNALTLYQPSSRARNIVMHLRGRSPQSQARPGTERMVIKIERFMLELAYYEQDMAYCIWRLCFIFNIVYIAYFYPF